MEVKEFWEKRENIEASAEETTKLLGWQYTDVLYSFLGFTRPGTSSNNK